MIIQLKIIILKLFDIGIKLLKSFQSLFFRQKTS